MLKRSTNRAKSVVSDNRPAFASFEGDARELVVRRLEQAIRGEGPGSFMREAESIVAALMRSRPVWPACGNGPGKGGVDPDAAARSIVDNFPTVSSAAWLIAEELNQIPEALWDHPTRGHEARVRHWLNEVWAAAHAYKFDREQGPVLGALDA